MVVASMAVLFPKQATGMGGLSETWLSIMNDYDFQNLGNGAFDRSFLFVFIIVV